MHLRSVFFRSARLRSHFKKGMLALALGGLVASGVNLSVGPVAVQAAPATTVRIANPLSNQTYTGSIDVHAVATNAQRASYKIDAGAERALSYDASALMWAATLDSRTLTNGAHNLDVINYGADGTTATDRAWNIQVANGGAPAIAIANPLSNQHYAGTIQVQARATGFQSVGYSVDGGARVPMTYQASAQLWSAALDSTRVSSGAHNIDVVGRTSTGAVGTDRAWSVVFGAATLATDVASPTPKASATPAATMLPSPTPVATVLPSPTAVATTPAGGSSSKLFGVNLAGGEFAPGSLPGTLNTTYIYPADAAHDRYLAARGQRLVRLPILWERVQPSPFGALSAIDVAAIRVSLDSAQAAGQQVILELHNYGRYYNAPLARGDAAKLASVWHQLAQTFQGHPALYGYELMNEPHDLPDGADGWAAVAQAATDSIRQVDRSAWVLVPGYSWQGAWTWAQQNPTLNVQDSTGRLVYAAHQYFDTDGSGTYSRSYDAQGAYPGIGSDRLRPFLDWLSAHNAHGMLTEYGVPGSDARWLTVLDGFMSTLNSTPTIQGGTYWAAGPWWGTYPLSAEPTNGVDAPQMGILSRYASPARLIPVPIIAPPPSIVIQNPLSHGTYGGSMVVQANATGALGVSYEIDGGANQTMTRDPATGLWAATFDTRTLADGHHNVTVSATDADAVAVTDKAWNVEITNATVGTGTPVSSSHYVFGLIGDDTTLATLSSEHAAGVRAKIVRLSWKDYLPAEGLSNASYVSAKRSELAQLRQAGFGVILDLGLQDTPSWLHQNYADSYYVDQYGDRYGDPTQPDQGDANLVFNPAIRLAAADYLGRVFADLGIDYQAVRLGGGRWGELTYPPATYNGHANTYWAFDTNAQRLSTSPAWRPGQSQPNGEARAFVDSYMNALVDFQNWQVATVRRAYSGSLMMLYPSWGIRPGQLDEAIAGNLSGGSSAEINGEVQRGFDFARQISALTDPGMVVTTTWLDADATQDAGNDARYWSPVKYLAGLAGAHPLKLRTFGENTGQGNAGMLGLAAAQMERFHLMGMAWFTESELLGGRYATLNDYAAAVGSAL